MQSTVQSPTGIRSLGAVMKVRDFLCLPRLIEACRDTGICALTVYMIPPDRRPDLAEIPGVRQTLERLPPSSTFRLTLCTEYATRETVLQRRANDPEHPLDLVLVPGRLRRGNLLRWLLGRTPAIPVCWSQLDPAGLTALVGAGDPALAISAPERHQRPPRRKWNRLKQHLTSSMRMTLHS